MHWIEKLAFKIIEQKFETGKVLFLDDIDDLALQLKNEDELWNIIRNQESEIKDLNEKIMRLQYEIDSPMVLLNEIRKERMRMD